MGGYKEVEPRWEPGQLGNPNGRPSHSITALLREYDDADELEVTIIKHKGGEITQTSSKLSTDGKQSLNQIIAARLVYLAAIGDLKAIQIVLDRTEGKVNQPVSIKGSLQSTPFQIIDPQRPGEIIDLSDIGAAMED